MKRLLIIAALSLLALGGGKVVAQGLPDGFKPRTTYKPATHMVEEPAAIARPNALGLSSVVPLPSWTYTVEASADRGGASYSGTIIGRSPYLRGKTTTTIPTQIIPLIITIDDGSSTVTYDPTTPDTCGLGGATAVAVVEGSPIFTNNSWNMNGAAVGNTQYIDAFQRAQFWSLVAGTPYHLILSRSDLAPQALSFTTANSTGPIANFNFGGSCGPLGIVQINDLDKAVQALITGPLAGMVNAGTFPIFLTKSVVSAEGAIPNNCCVLGYHSGLFVGSNLQIYSPLTLDASGAFGGDVTVMSHEIGEAINDPTANNPTPPWGNIGQTVGVCQNNFEVGDPLSPGFGTPTNPFVVAGYHLQELAFFSWFYGGTSLGAGGGFSDNGTFEGDAINCPPGGTN